VGFDGLKIIFGADVCVSVGLAGWLGSLCSCLVGDLDCDCLAGWFAGWSLCLPHVAARVTNLVLTPCSVTRVAIQFATDLISGDCRVGK